MLKILDNTKTSNEDKRESLDKFLSNIFPEIEGDTVTFIGSTFQKLTETHTYLNHMVVLNSCDEIPEVKNSVIECYDTEEELLLGWKI